MATQFTAAEWRRIREKLETPRSGTAYAKGFIYRWNTVERMEVASDVTMLGARLSGTETGSMTAFPEGGFERLGLL